MVGCHGAPGERTGPPEEADMVVALVGNANVGKSAIFNQLTGLEQTVGNWPGKTVEKAEGTLYHHNKRITIYDLPGSYSLSPFSPDEEVTREFLLSGRADVVVNVLDATALERNLYLTLQLLEMRLPVVVALNFDDMTRRRGIHINRRRLAALLGVPVIPTVAVRGQGVHELIDAALEQRGKPPARPPPTYGPEIEKRVGKLERLLERVGAPHPKRWTAVKLLEGDEALLGELSARDPRLREATEILSGECSGIHGEPCSTVIASERYAVIGRVLQEVQSVAARGGGYRADALDAVTMHPVWGYALMLAVMLSILFFVSEVGGWVSQSLEAAFESLNPQGTGFWSELLWSGAVVGLYAGLGVALGFLLPFYFILSALENSGYLPRVAFLMDRPCHFIGLHGKASIPLIVAFGCNVPACVGCRIIETKRDRLIATVLSTLVPCSARTAVILGIIGTYMGALWAMSLYVFDLLLIIALGRLLNRTLGGSSPGIIMEIPPFRTPVPRLVAGQAWSRFRPFAAVALPLIVAGSTVIELLRLVGALEYITRAMAPVTVAWLGLPAFTGILFILGILRKEAAVALLASVAGTVSIPSVMTPLQMLVFSLVMMVYIPCVATIAALVKETGLRFAALVTVGEILLAILLGGVALRLLDPLI
ncbi:MAG: ferrous iron transport protein B [Thermoplasmatota archaeon]